jgi:hypothetical protein
MMSIVRGKKMTDRESKVNTAEANPPTLQKLFEDSSVAKLLDFLTLYRDFDYPKTEISKNSGVSWKTLYRLWPLLEKYDLVIKTRQIGRATLYKLNTESPIAQALNKLALEIAAFGVTEELARQAKEQKTRKTEPIPA